MLVVYVFGVEVEELILDSCVVLGGKLIYIVE